MKIVKTNKKNLRPGCFFEKKCLNESNYIFV